LILRGCLSGRMAGHP